MEGGCSENNGSITAVLCVEIVLKRTFVLQEWWGCVLIWCNISFSPVEYGTVGMLSEVMHLTGLQGLRDNDVVPLSQLSSVLSELYGAIRAARPVLKPAQLQQAQDCAYNWLQLAYKT